MADVIDFAAAKRHGVTHRPPLRAPLRQGRELPVGPLALPIPPAEHVGDLVQVLHELEEVLVAAAGFLVGEAKNVPEPSRSALGVVIAAIVQDAGYMAGNAGDALAGEGWPRPHRGSPEALKRALARARKLYQDKLLEDSRYLDTFAALAEREELPREEQG